MANVNLRGVVNVLQELVQQLVDDEKQRTNLRHKFLRNLENEESVLLQELSSSTDNDVLLHQKVKHAKHRLEDACFADIAAVVGDKGLNHLVKYMRKLSEHDVMIETNEEMEAQEVDESSRLLSDSNSDKQIPWQKRIMHYVPIIKWTRNYKIKTDLPGDLFAGCTVAFMTFPQTMGYAILAGLPPIYGLYAAFVPVFIYSIFGTSAEMSVGPAAMVALMIPDILADFAKPETPEYILFATFLSFFSGMILFLAGLLNGGFIVENILSVPLLTGWIQGAAMLIVLSQLGGLLQIKIPSTSNALVSVIQSISKTISTTNGWSVLIGGVCLILLFGSRKLSEHRKFKLLQKIPISLLVLALVTALTRIYRWDLHLKINIIAEIPQGLPNFKFFSLSLDLIQTSFKAALAIAIIGFMEGISLAKKFAGLRKYRIDVSQELRALGLANMIGSCFKAFPVTGSVTRTTVNYQSGSRTTYSSVVNGILVGAVLLFLSPLFYYTPKAALAAIVISAGLSLIDIAEIRFLWRIKAKLDLAQLLFIFLVTLFTGPEVGAVVAILVSVLQIIYRSSRPTCVTLGPIPGTTVYKTGPVTKSTSAMGILVVRLDSGLFFFTTSWLKENLFTWEDCNPVPVKAVVMDATVIDHADATGVHGLIELIEEYQKRNICIFFSNVRPKLMETLELAGIVEKAGIDSFFVTTHEAVMAAQGLSYSERMRMTITLIN